MLSSQHLINVILKVYARGGGAEGTEASPKLRSRII